MTVMPNPDHQPSQPVLEGVTRHQVMLVDDHALFRTGLRLIMAQNPRVSPDVLEAGSIPDALALLRQQPCPDLLLLDVVMPGVNGLDGLRLLRQACPQTRIAVLSAIADISMEKEALARGADGFVSKSADAEEIHRALDDLLDGRCHFPRLDNLMHLPNTSTTKLQLTARQLEVLSLMAEGGSNKVIARKLDLSENTVRVHVAAILDHFGVSTRMEAMFAARNQGVIA